MLLTPGGLVYGTILIASLLAAESARRETYAKTVAAVVIAIVMYWLALSYAEDVEHRASSTGVLFGVAIVQLRVLLH